jgi:predicted TIM-barrel fold metal-dependent hydrolase
VSAAAANFRPERFGLPSAADWKSFRIWDSYYFPRIRADRGAWADSVAEDLRELEPLSIERFCTYVHVGLGTTAGGARTVTEDPEHVQSFLERWRERLLGVINLNANDVAGSLAALDRWVKRGPVVGVYFKSSPPGCLACTHPNFDPLVERCGELGAMIMQHTWFKAGGKDDVGESTPAELAILAQRHPHVNFVCAHAGGDWERGIRAIAHCPNVLIETSGFDPTSGFIDFAVREIGAERIVFGSHFMSRSVGTECSKILEADISDRQRELIFGGNLRRLLQAFIPAGR